MKPIVYIASPYTKGDPAINVRFQCQTFDKLLTSGLVLPIAPLWCHFQHIQIPRSYETWVNYWLEMIPKFDACLRLTAICDLIEYRVSESKGADQEEAAFFKLGKPIFYNIQILYEWAEKFNKGIK